jgi:hypothetical protein
MMPHGFEYVVRPFQSPGSLGNVIIPGQSKPTSEQAHITWGGVGTMPSVKVLNPDSRVDICHEALGEQDRKSERVRIPIQETDGAPYIEVDRAKQMNLKKNNETASTALVQWQGFTLQKLDPRLADNPNLEPKSDPGSNAFPKFEGTCLVEWNFKNQ